jgi:hypothetical protein
MSRIDADALDDRDKSYWQEHYGADWREAYNRNYYYADPCFMQIVEKQFHKGPKDFSLEQLAQLYPIWQDGYRMGRYGEATKDAEGS